MIVNENSEPRISLYFLGAKALEAFTLLRANIADPMVLYIKTRETLNVELSFARFQYALDWLFLIGAIDLASNGNIKKCF
jgi:hypothetical protein